MKTIVVGDIHGRTIWKNIVNSEKFDRLIFIGDYFDSYDIDTESQVNNFLDIIEYKNSSDAEIIMLIGNHDFHYFPEIGDTRTSGYQRVGKFMIEPVIDSNRHHLQMAYQMDNFLFTHAGVSSAFMNNTFGYGNWKTETIANQLNELFKYKPGGFTFNGIDPYGNDSHQTPIWIRPKALMNANYNSLRNEVIQVVGHTTMNSIDYLGKATGKRYFFIDTIGTSKEYLTIEDGVVGVGNIKWK